MKQRLKITVFFSVLVFTLQIQAQKGTRLKIKIEALHGQYTQLWSYYGNHKIYVDSVRFGENGLANYHAKKPLPHGLYRLVLPNSNSFEIIITEPLVSLETDLVTPVKSMVVKSSAENTHYYKLKHFLSLKRKEMNAFTQAHANGTINKHQFDKKSLILNYELKEYKNNLIEDAKGLLIADLIQAGMKPQIDTAKKETYADYLNKYLDQINFQNSALLHSPVLDTKVISFINEVVAPYPHKKTEAIGELIKRCNPENANYLTKRFIEKYKNTQTLGNDEIFTYLITNHLDKTDYSDEQKTILGTKASILEKHLRGKPFYAHALKNKDKLQAIKAKYTLIILWDKSTRRKELELLFDFSQSYAKYDLKVFSVAIEDELTKLHIGQQNKWINVKESVALKDELLMKQSTILILLDKNKKILARNIHLDDLIDTLDFWER